MVEGTMGSHHKEGSRKMSKHSMICAGIDTGKRKLDVALNGRPDRLQVENTAEGHTALWGWLRQHRVKRVGIEASGGYEQEIVRELRRKGLWSSCSSPHRCEPMPGSTCNWPRTTRSMRP